MIHAQVLLILNETFNNWAWLDEESAETCHINISTICDTTRRFVEGSFFAPWNARNI
ncbi:MAG: hypothetical protein BACD_02298 [Bacteroides rodentium]